MESGGREKAVLEDLVMWEGVRQRAVIVYKERGSAE